MLSSESYADDEESERDMRIAMCSTGRAGYIEGQPRDACPAVAEVAMEIAGSGWLLFCKEHGRMIGYPSPRAGVLQVTIPVNYLPPEGEVTIEATVIVHSTASMN